MAYYAFLDDNNTVVQVIVGRDPGEVVNGVSDWEAHYANSMTMRCLRTDDTGFRKQFASVGYTYDEAADVFVQPQPYPSWVLDASHDWQPPTPMPTGLLDYEKAIWNEDLLIWEVK